MGEREEAAHREGRFDLECQMHGVLFVLRVDDKVRSSKTRDIAITLKLHVLLLTCTIQGRSPFRTWRGLLSYPRMTSCTIQTSCDTSSAFSNPQPKTSLRRQGRLWALLASVAGLLYAIMH